MITITSGGSRLSDTERRSEGYTLLEGVSEDFGGVSPTHLFAKIA